MTITSFSNGYAPCILLLGDSLEAVENSDLLWNGEVSTTVLLILSGIHSLIIELWLSRSVEYQTVDGLRVSTTSCAAIIMSAVITY